MDHIGTAIKDPEKYDEKVADSEEVDPIEPVKKSTTVFLNFSKKATPRFTNMNIPVTQMPTAQVKPNKGSFLTSSISKRQRESSKGEAFPENLCWVLKVSGRILIFEIFKEKIRPFKPTIDFLEMPTPMVDSL